MKGNVIRVGIIGAGGNTRALHIPLLQAIPGVEVVAVANRSTASAEAAAAPFGIRRATDRWESLIEDPGIDAVCIGTWPYLHAPATLVALEAGKHVLCEARMACDAAEARAMLAASRRHPDLAAQIVPSPFTLAIDDTICALLADGAIGSLLAVDLVHTAGSFRSPETALTWRQDRRLSGLNALTMGIWYEALMRWTGPAASVAAMTTVSVPRRRDADGILQDVQVPDHIDIVGRLVCGASLNMRFSAITGLVPQMAVHLCGTEGTLVVQGSPAQVLMGRRGDTVLAPVAIPPPAPGPGPAGWRVEQEFIAAIRGEAPVRRTTFADGVRYMEFTEAVHLSALERRVVDIPCTGKTA
jgi:predicted dehydrogenase